MNNPLLKLQTSLLTWLFRQIGVLKMRLYDLEQRIKALEERSK